MPPSSRRPRTVTNSKYSVRERQRARYALASHKFQRGYSDQTLFEKIEKSLGDVGVFKDRQSVKEFLQGAESEDDKIDAVIQYLATVDPKLAASFDDDGFEALVADVFSQMFQPKLNDATMREQWPRAERFAGFYQFVEERFPTEASRTQILHLTTVPNAHYLRASLLEVKWSLHPQAPEEFVKLDFPVHPTQIGGVPAAHDDYTGAGAEADTLYHSSNRASKSFAEHLLNETRAGGDPIIPYFYEATGFLFPRDDTHFFMFQRDTDNFSPIFFIGGLFDDGKLEVSYFDANRQLLRLQERKMPLICDYLSYRRLSTDVEKVIESFLANAQENMR